MFLLHRVESGGVCGMFGEGEDPYLIQHVCNEKIVKSEVIVKRLLFIMNACSVFS